ncbi:Protein-export membrane protein SecD [Hyphomicrobium sulfonivorans]|uniref:Protein translocase subunit SecD n=1 Tax=Hyphomicrobium sulfonivorans TaxID=121290 RepID=A0A120CXW1_HYPSL|nr:protein translocase subunit SecD [Hyphomicrobium sulfonivorans]KWT71564.1 Protein-export membrane protein SecD [Hyphomicrobium sulfonivorans]
MLHFERWKIIAIVMTCMAGIFFTLPNFFSKETVESWPSWMPHRQLPLGLDLQGGAHLLLALDTKELEKDWLTTMRDDARKQLREAKVGFTGLGIVGNAVQVKISKPEELEKAKEALDKLVLPIGSALMGTGANDISVAVSGADTIMLAPTQPGMQHRISSAVSAAIETVNRRVNAMGTSESTVVRQGSDRILVQFPGLHDTTLLKDLIGQTAKLTFHSVHPTMSAEDAAQSRPPVGYKVYPGVEGEESGRSYLLRDSPVVSGEDLVDSQPGFDSRTNEPIISFRFNQSGARKFGNFTKDHVGQPFAIVLDNKVLSAPVIREPILGGSGQISGSFTVESANTLAVQLRSGALPAKLTVVEERSVGPSLGADSIEAGKLAGLVGLLLTAILTTVAYGTFGVIACVGLLVHGFLILALMTMIGATLTLPGIAGFVLTIGMAVDANVLIYERMREELRNGKSPIAAIENGFQRAFVTIFDSQLTTLFAAIIMFWLGSGPIRGFAVTLTLGILTSVFAAVTVTRLLVALWLKSAKSKGRITEVPV